MSIADELVSEMKDAMRAKDKRRLNVIRQIQTEVMKAKSAPGFAGDVDDDLYVSVIAQYSKRMDKARAEFEAAGERGADQAEVLAYEVGYLEQWLPAKLDEEATGRLVVAAIADLGASDVKEAGKVIGHVMRSAPDVDGGVVNRLVREALGG